MRVGALLSVTLAGIGLVACATQERGFTGGGDQGAGDTTGPTGTTSASKGPTTTAGSTTTGSPASTSTGSSCTDNLQNGDETDIDCGGSCAPCNDGSNCDGPTDCVTGFCVEGVCCESACTGVCESCVEAATGDPNGVCAPITPGAQCAPGSCVGGTATAASTCDANGTCVPGLMTSCNPYVCDPGTMMCKTTCTSNADCNVGTCNVAVGACEVPQVVIDTHNFMGMTEYPLDTDVCGCCGATTTAETAQAICVLAGLTTAVSWTTGMINGTNCYCWDCITVNSWANNCCLGQSNRPMILTVTCQ
ncbi:MAG: hypothetical protein HOV80_27460 [Polyangiaceae bacterium]|nr:hypothetical protein [Polyangiaceae bacterium]